MELIQITAENLADSHICCALGKTKEERACAATKKAWMQDAFADGYTFTRLDAQGKAFIETTSAENAWAPIIADNWLFVDCFWISGRFKKQGLATRLLDTALQRAQREGRYGLVAVSSDKKRPFLSDPGFWRHKGFVTADTAPPHFELLALPLSQDAALPRFGPSVRQPVVPARGVFICYSAHCPYTEKYVNILKNVCEIKNAPFTAQKLSSKAEAQAAPCPFTTWAMFFDGAFVTTEIFSEGKMMKFLS